MPSSRRSRSLPDEAPDTAFAFFILEIDDFKAANDRLGYSAGGEALALFGAAGRMQFTPYDIAGRIGGDEFATLAPFASVEADDEKAAELVEALRVVVQTDAGGMLAFGLGGHRGTNRHAMRFLIDVPPRRQGAPSRQEGGKNRYARAED